MAIVFQTNKNIVLLYSLLNHHRQAFGDINTTELRKDVVEHFKKYQGQTPDVEKYVHSSKTVTWALIVGPPPQFARKINNLDERTEYHYKRGEYIKTFLVDFYNKTEFEEYYSEILPKLEKLVSSFRTEFENTNIENLLENVWNRKIKENMVVIPNPYTQDSFGPKIGNVNYQVLGVWIGRDISSYDHNIIHEGSHPLAKEILDQYAELIDTKNHLLEDVQKNESYPKAYNHWGTCFEEHLIRAVHKGIINPKIKKDYNVEKALQREIDMNGMVLITKFYEVLKSSESVEDAIPAIVSSL